MSAEKVGMTLENENDWLHFISQTNIVIKTTT